MSQSAIQEAIHQLFERQNLTSEQAEAAMTLGRTYLTTESDAKPLSRHGIDLIAL